MAVRPEKYPDLAKFPCEPVYQERRVSMNIQLDVSQKRGRFQWLIMTVHLSTMQICGDRLDGLPSRKPPAISLPTFPDGQEMSKKMDCEISI
jgi:hypothetical protein